MRIFATLQVPILKWLKVYDIKDDLFGDVVAGITVFILLVPQGIAYSILAELPPVYGLYTSTVPLIVYALFGTSRHISMGPFAITCLLIGNATAKYGYDINSHEQVILVRTITLLHSIITLSMGFFKLGLLANFLSHSVLTGFVSGSACIIILNQAKYILGLAVPRFTYSVQTIGYILSHMNECNWISIVISIFSLTLLYTAKKYKLRNKDMINKNIFLKLLFNSTSLICIVVGTIISYCTYGQNKHLQIVGYVPPGFMSPSIEISSSISTIISLAPSSFVISIISFTGCYAIATKFSAQYRYDVDPTQELLAQGLASLFGLIIVNSFVVSGGLARSAVNVESGARTQISSIITATLMILSLLTITSLFYYIPMAVLGSVIIISVMSMIEFNVMKDAFHIDKMDFSVMTVTFLFTFFIGIIEGVSIGIFLSMLFVLKKSAFPQIVHLGRMEVEGDPRNRDIYRDILRNNNCKQIPGIAVVRMDAPLFFANCAHFKSTVHAAAQGRYHTNLLGQSIRMVIIDVSMWGSPPDFASLLTLNEVHEELLAQSIQISFACAKGPLRDRLNHVNFVEKVGAEFFFLTIDEAVSAVPKRLNSLSKELSSYGHLSSSMLTTSLNNMRSSSSYSSNIGTLSLEAGGGLEMKRKKDKKDKKKNKSKGSKKKEANNNNNNNNNDNNNDNNNNNNNNNNNTNEEGKSDSIEHSNKSDDILIIDDGDIELGLPL